MKPRRNPESGFVLLFVYAMAATIAVMLYLELPRVAFEAQRDKEQLLIDRGEQYSRAINLYVRKFNRYPADFDALQNTQNLRFLRRKYVDPMTGKDEWRIIHVGPGGVFTDSLIYNKKKGTKEQTERQNFITEIQQTGGDPVAAAQSVNIGTRQRQSDQPGAPGDPNNPVNPNAPPQFDATGQPIQNAANNGQNGFGLVNPNQPGFPGPGQFQPGANGFPGGMPPGAPGFPPGAQMPPGQQVNQPPNTAVGLINQLLTTPRPGGMNGVGGFQPGGAAPGNIAGTTTTSLSSPSTASSPISNLAPAAAQVIGGGIAGVATKLDQEGIKVYKDQTSYNKWEFVYDISKDPARTGGTVPQAGAAPPGANAAPNSTASPFGPNPAPNGIPSPSGTMPPAPAGPAQ